MRMRCSTTVRADGKRPKASSKVETIHDDPFWLEGPRALVNQAG